VRHCSHYQRPSLNLVLSDSASKNGRISGTMLQTTSFMKSIQLLANASTTISYRVSRCNAVIMNRLKIGHSRLTHTYLLSGEDQPICTKCDTVLIVKHILLDCPELRDVRLKYFTASSLKDIFESVDNQSIIGFNKDAHFYHHLYYLLSIFCCSYKALIITLLFISFFSDFAIIIASYFQLCVSLLHIYRS